MIIKVPVYVELIGKVDQSSLAERVRMLEHEIYLIVRKHDFGKITNSFVPAAFLRKDVEDFRIVSREQALEYLRTKK
jgi:hypothetical protein